MPKGSKPKPYLKHRRPIALLLVFYKVVSLSISRLINEDQKGFMSGRYIGEITRQMYDLIEYTDTYRIPGILLLVDFAKSFWHCRLDLHWKNAHFLSLWRLFKKWIYVFYKGFESSVLVNGFGTPPFDIFRGCRQGDRLSPYLFRSCVKFLAIRNNTEVKWIDVGNIEYLLNQFADYTTCSLDGSERCLQALL